MLEDNDDDMVVLAAVSCFMRRKLTRIHHMTISSVNRVFRRVVKAVVSMSGQYIRWQNGES